MAEVRTHYRSKLQNNSVSTLSLKLSRRGKICLGLYLAGVFGYNLYVATLRSCLAAKKHEGRGLVSFKRPSDGLFAAVFESCNQEAGTTLAQSFFWPVMACVQALPHVVARLQVKGNETDL